MRITSKQIPTLLFFLTLFCYMVVINYLYPKMVDDLYYSLHFSSLIDAFSQSFSATKLRYLTWSGRLPPNFLQALLLPFMPLFSVLNAAIFCLFINGIFLTTTLRAPSKLRDFATLIIITTIVWFFIVELAESTLWKVGAIAYLWPITATLYFIYPFLKLLTSQPIKFTSGIKIALFSGAALLLGAAHESLSIPILIFLLFINFFCWRYHKKIPTWVISSSIAYLIGLAILIIAPGNYVRARSISSQHLNNLSYYAEKFFAMTKAIGVHLATRSADSLPLGLLILLALWLLIINGHIKNWALRIVLGLLSIYASYEMITQPHIRMLELIILGLIFLTFLLLLLKNYRNNPQSLLFFILSFISAYTLLAIPYVMYGDRTSFFPDTFLLMSIMAIFAKEYPQKYWQLLYQFIAAICLICLIVSGISNFFNVKLFNEQWQKRVQLMLFYKNNKINNAILPSYYIPAIQAWANTSGNNALLIRTGHIYITDLSKTDPADWRNRTFASYHNLPGAKITLTPFVELWSDIEKQLHFNNSKQSPTTLTKDQNLYLVFMQSCDSLPNNSTYSIQNKPGGNNINLTLTPDHLVTILAPNGEIKRDVCILAIPEAAHFKLKT